jgi:predicted nucleic acid-binding protein
VTCIAAILATICDTCRLMRREAVANLNENPILALTLAGFADLAIGAIAQQHNLTILTRNIKHYSPLGLAALDPVAELPPE